MLKNPLCVFVGFLIVICSFILVAKLIIKYAPDGYNELKAGYNKLSYPKLFNPYKPKAQPQSKYFHQTLQDHLDS